jgi:hypothetical protein
VRGGMSTTHSIAEFNFDHRVHVTAQTRRCENRAR